MASTPSPFCERPVTVPVAAAARAFPNGAQHPAAPARNGAQPQSQPQSQPQKAQQQQLQSDLEKLRRDLNQPGPEAREVRERAVDALLLMREPRAHAVLQETMQRGDDPDGLTRFVLDSLARKLAQKADPVFGDNPLRPVMLESYVPALVRTLAGIASPSASVAASPSGGANGGGANGGGAGGSAAENAVGAELQNRVLRALRQLTHLERKDAFSKLFAAEDAALARGALLAAGGCEDLNLAPLMAKKLADPKLGPAARDALMRLTFAARPFQSEPDFDEWFTANSGRTYKELAVEAAVRSREALAAVRQQSDLLVRQQTKKLVRALARAEKVDWVALRNEILDPALAGGTAAYLEELRVVLASRGALDGVIQDRLAFAEALQQRLAAAADPADYALLLETIAHLQVRENAEQMAAVEQLLRGALEHPAAQVRRASLRGLVRYPSPQNRAAVLATATRLLAEGDRDSLAAALTCLDGRGWYAPDPDDADVRDWLSLLRQVFASDIAAADKELATKVAIQQDGQGRQVPGVFDVLVDVLRDKAQSTVLRTQTLIRLRAFTGTEQRADEYVWKVIGLLDDPDTEIRKLATEQLKTLPDGSKSKQREWKESIIPRASERLLAEPEKKVVSALVDLLLTIAEDPAHRSTVIGRFNKEVTTFAESSPPAAEAFRQQVLVKGLQILGSGQVPNISQWVAAGRALVKLRERDALRAILSRQQVATLAGQNVEGVRGAMELCIEAALLKPDDVPWAKLPVEMNEVQTAFAELERLGAPFDTPDSRALRVLCLAGIGQHADVATRGSTYLASSDKALTGAQQVAVILAVARSMLALENLAGAERMLSSLEPIGANPPEALGLWIDLAERHMQKQAASAARSILAELLPRIPRDSPDYRRSFLLDADARFTLDPEQNRETVLNDLDARSSLFSGDEVPKPMRDRFEALRRRVAGSGG